ncbi:MAG: hypothetical protein LKI25_08295 [Atopobiaceae bacterium]|jgi:hypothetical protein|nr:hypothetical protein [Atopobiaceae bacterium]MCI2174187.1 hypothetical protein [Atopobiaceae bacterium]MCI2206828.1 hypothetical protein [Atopobiaceae bacterium]
MGKELQLGRYYLHVPFIDANVMREIDFPWALDGPLDVLVANEEYRRESNSLHCHVWSSPPPPGAFRLMGRHVLISSPEYTFLQMASALDLFGLIMLGYELCGKYSTGLDNRSLSQRPPLMTPDSLKKTLLETSSFNGKPKARRAVSHILANSASPRETAVAMLLSLPKRLGGYGLPQPTLNPWFRGIGREDGWRSCDIFWNNPMNGLAGLDLEYESDMFHTGADRIAADSRRRAQLRESGIEVITLTNEQLKCKHDLDCVVGVIRKVLGIYDRSPSYDHAERNRVLRERIL